MLQTNWEVDGDKGCLGFNRTARCYQGAVPLYTVNATTIEHVQNTVIFAATQNVRLVVKNTGHDFFGRSTGPSSLCLWVFYNKSIAFDDYYVPEGASNGTKGSGAIILGSGVLWRDAYKAAEDKGVVLVGGAAGTVGTSGGYCQGGGHSPLSRLYGLCVDNVLQYKVVAADGSVKIANAFQNKDLFWALRGGGGGTFGVVVEAIYRTHPALRSVNIATYQLYFEGRETRRKLINSWLSRQVGQSTEGWSGYSTVEENAMIIGLFLPDKDQEIARSSISPFLDYAQSLGVLVMGVINSYSSFWSAFEAMESALAITTGLNGFLGSRLIPRKNLEAPSQIEELTNSLIKAQAANRGFGDSDATFSIEHVAGGAVANGSSVETSVHPAWRDALLSIFFSSKWEDDLPLTKQQAIGHQMTSTIQLLRDITPESGAYFNEADPNEPNWQENFFGSNYPRLKGIKDKVDPMGLFVCHNCVGSEDWSDDLSCPRVQ
ncbi:hypothetical protein BGX28_004207 [Mortierella sp. GBA30]|nr:hypothetical protein BGX28_004207 [Mortierella sp. GBA30]